MSICLRHQAADKNPTQILCRYHFHILVSHALSNVGGSTPKARLPPCNSSDTTHPHTRLQAGSSATSWHFAHLTLCLLRAGGSWHPKVSTERSAANFEGEWQQESWVRWSSSLFHCQNWWLSVAFTHFHSSDTFDVALNEFA